MNILHNWQLNLYTLKLEKKNCLPTRMLHPQRSYNSFDVCANQQARTLVERNNAPVTKID